MENHEEAIKKHAIELGFDLAGITDASAIPSDHIAYLKHWLADGYAGQMAYMHKNFEKRVDPSLLLDGAKSVICVAINYKFANSRPAAIENDRTFGKISAYACYQDYHQFMKEKLCLLANFIAKNSTSDCKIKICVDSVPLAERALAARAGLGFIAKNHMLTHPVLGQQLLLGELITDVQLQPDQPLPNDCSGCGQCIKACPTGALSTDGTFDARRCISYLTIEHKEIIPQELTAKIGNRIFGCDRCVLSCRRQKAAPCASNREFVLHNDLQSLDVRRIVEMNDDEFKKAFADSPIQRLGLDRLKRNALICLQNAINGDTTEQQIERGAGAGVR